MKRFIFIMIICCYMVLIICGCTKINYSYMDIIFNGNRYGEYIYYPNYNNSGLIYRCNLELKKHEKIHNYSASGRIQVFDKYIYFTDRNHRIVKASINGDNIYKLNNKPSSSIQVTEMYVYYINMDDNYNLYRMNHNGGNKIKIIDNFITTYIVTNKDNIYYEKNNCIYYIDNSTFKTSMILENVSDFIVYNDWIYYSNSEDNGYLYKARINGEAVQQIVSLTSEQFVLFNNQIYFHGFTDNKEFIYKLNPEIDNIKKLDIIGKQGYIK